MYTMYSVGGGGTKTGGGEWEIKETEKTITFTEVKKSYFGVNFKSPLKINKFHNNYRYYEPAFTEYATHTSYGNNGHVLRKWKNGSMTLYPNQSGTPHVFTKKITCTK